MKKILIVFAGGLVLGLVIAQPGTPVIAQPEAAPVPEYCLDLLERMSWEELTEEDRQGLRGCLEDHGPVVMELFTYNAMGMAQ